MLRLFLLVISFAFYGLAYAGGGEVVAKTDECTWVQQGDCDTKCPACPKVKSCPKAKTNTVTKWKTRVQTKYVNVPVEKVVYKTVDKTLPMPTHTFGLLGGLGPDGIVRDYYDTKERPKEYAFRKGDGALLGLQYQYRFTSNWSISAMVLSNPTVLGGLHYSK
jgi:hypothetical protein